MSNIDDLLEQSINHISLRISDVESEFFRIAGSTLRTIYNMSDEQIRNYLYSADSDRISSDINRVKRLLNEAHEANVMEMQSLFNEVTAEAYEEGETLAAHKSTRLSPANNYRQAVNPLLRQAVKDYEVMANSAASSTATAYRSTIRKYVNRLTGDTERINFPQAMRKAIRELTDQGVSFVDYESGHRRRMDSAVRMTLMNEYTNIVQEVERKLADEIGADGVEISAHQHSAEDHEPFQGHMFTNEEFEKLQNGESAEDTEGECFPNGSRYWPIQLPPSLVPRNYRYQRAFFFQ